MEDVQREMTLEEWVSQLPSFHLANQEYDALLSRIAELEDELRTTARDGLDLAQKLYDRIAELEQDNARLRTRLHALGHGGE